MEMARDFASYKASDNLFGELGPVCGGEINATWPGSSSPYTCTGKWTGKVKFGAPHVVSQYVGVFQTHFYPGAFRNVRAFHA